MIRAFAETMASSDDLVVRGEWQEFPETPDAAEIQRLTAVVPAGLKFTQGFWDRNLIPVVLNIQQTAAAWARGQNLTNVEGGSTARVQAGLESMGHGISPGVVVGGQPKIFRNEECILYGLVPSSSRQNRGKLDVHVNGTR